ncbi:MAG: LLM class flavin-dependent oxidoreductase [Caulobacteraceae bacterium]|nr:LLM class flavin-dependent oxidoreductase [Caulobacteraceae bacterium]
MGVRIGLGLADFPFTDGKGFWRWVELCEAGGIDSLWQADRLAGPAAFLECMSLMAALAGATKRMKFGMSVLSLGLREPFIVAKECATIDFLSGGRLLPAFGIGSPNSGDWAALGRDSSGQGGRTNQALEIIARLWRGETVDVEGPHFHYRDAKIQPLPVQQPLPLWIGGSSPAAIRRTARYGTGWLAGLESPEAVGKVVDAIKAEAEAIGRPMDPEHFGAGFSYRFGPPDDPLIAQRRALFEKAYPGRNMEKLIVAGGAADIVQRVRDYQAAGITKFVLRPIGKEEEDLALQTRRLIEEVIPAIHASPAPAAA